MPTTDDIAQQRGLLATHRRTLAHLLQQAAAHGGVRFAPPATANGIAEQRAEIARIKAALRGWGETVEDLPDELIKPIDMVPLFDSSDVYLRKRSIETELDELYEWKLIHTSVQGLLLNTLDLQESIRLVGRQFTEESVFQLENNWFSRCSPKGERILTVVSRLRLIRCGPLDELCSIIKDNTINLCIRNLNVEDISLYQRLHQQISTLLEVLREVMVITDGYISSITDKLRKVKP